MWETVNLILASHLVGKLGRFENRSFASSSDMNIRYLEEVSNEIL